MIKWLENWYKSNCDGEWEHENWIKIQSLDNPGWFLEIKAYNFFENSQERKWRLFEESEDNWIAYDIEKDMFSAAGDPSKLETLITLFKLAVEGKEIEDSYINACLSSK